MPWNARERMVAVKDKDLEPFLRSWLLCGLLHALLDHFDLYRTEDYVETDDDGCKLVHTRETRGAIQECIRRAQQFQCTAPFPLRSRMLRSLRIAWQTLDFPSLGGHHDFNRAVKLFILSICATIGAVGHVYIDQFSMLWPLFPSWADIDPPCEELMIRHGWCHGVVTLAKSSFLSVM